MSNQTLAIGTCVFLRRNGVLLQANGRKRYLVGRRSILVDRKRYLVGRKPITNLQVRRCSSIVSYI
jgi:hypothetical protein